MMTRYNIYPSLLDSYTRYQGCDESYERIWGFSETPSKTLEEWREEQLRDFLDALNRKPFRSVYADLGTTFNDLVDMYILRDKYKYIEGDIPLVVDGVCSAFYKGREYKFPSEMVLEMGRKYEGAIPQMYVEGFVETMYGTVKLYGYLDELMPFSVHDIKVTHRYEPWKFKGHAQHLVYPLCLWQMGVAEPTEFRYDIVEVRSNAKALQDAPEGDTTPCVVTAWEYHREGYGFNYDEALAELRKRCESFIEWIEAHRELIDNPKLFGQEL